MSEIITIIRGTPTRRPVTTERIPFSDVRLQGATAPQRSHVLPQEITTKNAGLFDLLDDELPDADRPFDPDDWLDNGQPLPSSNVDNNGTAIIDASQHRGSHPRVNDLVDERLASIHRGLIDDLAVTTDPAERRELAQAANAKIRNLADTIAAISVGGVVDPDHPELRAVYNRADPNAKVLWPEWDTWTTQQQNDKIAQHLDELVTGFIDADGSLTPQGANKLKVLRDLTSGHVGAVLTPQDAQIADRILADMIAHNIDPQQVDALAYSQVHGERLFQEGGELAERASKLAKFNDALKVAGRIGAKVVIGTAFAALDVYDYVDTGGRITAWARGDAEFSLSMDESRQFSGVDYLKDLATRTPQTGFLGDIPVLPETIEGVFGESAVRAALIEYMEGTYLLPTGLQFQLTQVTLDANDAYAGAEYTIDDLSTPGLDNVRVIYTNPLNGGGPRGAAMVLRRPNDGEVIVVQDVAGRTAHALFDPDGTLEAQIFDAFAEPDPQIREQKFAALEDGSRRSVALDMDGDTPTATSIEQAVELFNEVNLADDGIASGDVITVTPSDPDKGLVTVVIDGVVHVVRGAVHEIEQFLNALAEGPGVVLEELRRFGESGAGLIGFADIGQILGSQLSNALPIHDPWARMGASTAIGSLLTNVGQSLDLAGSATADGGEMALGQAIDEAFADFGHDVLQAGTGAVSSYLVGNLLNELGMQGDTLDASVAFAGPTIGKIAFNLLTPNTAWNAGLTTGFYANAAASFLGSKLADEIVTFDSVSGQIGAAVGEAVGSVIAAKLFAASLATGNPYAILAAAVVVAVTKILGGLIGSLFGASTSSATIVFDEEEQRFAVDHLTSKRGGSKAAARSLAGTVADTFNAVLEASGSKLLTPIEEQRLGMRNQQYVYWNPPSGYNAESRSRDYNQIVNFGVKVGLDQMIGQLGGGDVYAKRMLAGALATQTVQTFDIGGILGDFGVARDYGRYLANRTSINNLIAAAPDSAFALGWIATIARASELGIDRRGATDWTGGWNLFLDEMNDGSIDGSSWSVARVEFDFRFSRNARLYGFTDLDGVVNAYIADTIDNASKSEVVGTAGADQITIVGDQLQAGTVSIRQADGSLVEVDEAQRIKIAAVIDAGEANDTVHGGDLGNDIFGGEGDDALYGGRLDDWLLGGEGDDRLDAGSATAGTLGGDGNYLAGGAGNDQIFGREGSDWLEGGEGIDTLRAGAGGDILSGGAGAGDALHGGSGDDRYIIRRGDGADMAEDEDAAAPVPPATGDAIAARFAGIRAGTIQRDWLATSAPVIAARTAGGEDAIAFGQGITISDVRLTRSADGKDLLIELTVIDPDTGLEAFTGDSLLVKDWFANPFKRVEWLKFVDGTEVRIGDVTSFIVGTAGNDVLIGTDGNDFVYGGSGHDKLHLLAGNDIGLGGTGDDLVSGGADDDMVVGGLGADQLIGGSGDDAVTGDGGDDSIYGSQGADILSGGRGNDTIAGGAGNDRFKFARGDGHDTVFDDYSDNWAVAWQAGSWLNGYVYHPETSEVTAPDGSYVRRNFGTVGEPDLRWVGTFDYDDTTGQFRHFNPPADAATTVSDKGEDTIEFALDINVQDVMFARVAGTDDLRVIVGRANGEGSLAGSTDSITLRDWYDNRGSIETFAFFQAGEIDVSATGYNLIGGSDGQEGTDEANPLRGTAGKDWITGAGSGDQLAGGEGDDIVAGNAGSDHVKGEAGADVLYGGSGNDVLDGGLGGDVLSGGAGFDSASYASADNAVTVYLTNAGLNRGDASGDVYDSIEGLIGSGAGDVLGADEGDNELTGGKGNDSLLGGLGNDTYRWNIGDGADTIEDIAFVAETIISASGEIAAGYTVTWQQIGTSKKYDLRLTGPGGDVVYSRVVNIGSGSAAQPHPRYWPKQGWLLGFEPASDGSVSRVQHDTQVEAGDADAIELGAGISLADLGFERIGDDLKIAYVHVDDGNNGDGLALGQSIGANLLVRNHFLAHNRVEFLIFADGLSVSLETILAADSAGLVTGTAADELITGQRGVRDDTLQGAGGNDVISGGEGDDTIGGGEGDDVLEGGMGADVLDGGAHTAEPADGEEAASVLRGDTVRYATSSGGVTIDLALSSAQSGGDAAGDTLTGIENVTGSQHDDVLSGDAVANRLDGLAGNNTLVGRGGNDVLIAGDGTDLLDGGDGEDNLSSAGGNDTLHGGLGKDLLAAGEGDDQLFGDEGDDTLSADSGNDSLDGGAGADQLLGGLGNDTMLGGAGEDTLAGEEGNDSLQGGADADEYLVASGFGQDILIDSEGANEILVKSIAYDALWFHRAGDDLVMTVRGSDDRLTIGGFFAEQGAASIYSVQTETHRLFLGHPDVRNFLDAMQAAGPEGAPAQIPAGVAALMPRYWHEGDKATPWAEDFELEIAEDATTGLIAIGAIDHDENIADYRISTQALHGEAGVDDEGRFAYAPGLNFNGSDSFKVVVVDDDGNAREIEVTVSITPVDDAPVIDGPKDGPLAIDEQALLSNTATGSVVGTILASEFDGEAIVFTLSDDAAGRFAISADGVITVADGARLDHEAAAQHTVTVLVTDAVGSTDQETFAIAIRDVNEENALPSAYGWSVVENSAAGASVGTVAATDKDNPWTTFAEQRYAFAYAGGLHQVSEDGRYAIDAETGAVTVAAPGNFEAAEPTRTYEVVARDNAGAQGFTESRTQITIAITDVNEANAFAGDLAFELAENEGAGEFVGEVAASDLDTPGTTYASQRYFFWDGSQASGTSADGRFAIDPLTGAITATASYDYESDDREETYVVVARDNGGASPFFSAFHNVAISLTNVNETPDTPLLDSALSFVIEGAPAGALVASFTLTDVDGPVPALVADGNPGGLFTIVGGELRLAATVDFETLAGLGLAIGDHDADGRNDIGVSLSFHADDGELESARTAPLTVFVEDVNEAPSAIMPAGLLLAFAERDRIASGTARPAIALATLSVTDPDLAGQANAQYTFTVDDPRFQMVGNQLRLREDVSFDFEAESEVTVRVTATDISVDPRSISHDFHFAIENRDDILEGTPNADVLTGQANRDIITGLSGNDTLDGLTGDDDLLGNDGADSLLGGDGNDRLEGGSDNDAVHGDAGNDTLLGGTGHDVLSGGLGTDAVDGGAGDDIVVADADAAADAIQGGEGIDRLTFTHFGAGVTADLSASVANGDAVAGIEEIEGTGHADVLTGDGMANRLIGGAGDDSLSGLAGSDRLEGGDGADTLAGGADDDLLHGDAGTDALGGGTGSDDLYGGEGADSLLGDAGDDRLEGGRGNDVMDAGDGNDSYIVDRRTDHDVIFNYDGTGNDIDVLGFSDTHGEITEHDLWFAREGNDLLVTIVGENSSVRVVDWYLVTDSDSRANHRLDFLLGGEWFSRETDVEALVEFQSLFPRPGTIAELEDLRADPVYEATVATFFGINAPPTITGIADQRIDEDGSMVLTLTVGDDITPAGGVTLAGAVIAGGALLGPQGLVVGQVGADGRVTVTLTPAAHVAGTIDLSFTATDAGGVETTQQLRLTIDPQADTPVVTQLSVAPGNSGSAMAVSLAVDFPDRDGSEAHSIRIGGIPAGVSLNKGSYDGASGDWVLAPADLAGLTLFAPAGWSQDLDLAIRAYASEGASNAVSALATTHVVINAAPTDILSGLTVTENATNGSAIGHLVGVDPDGDQLSYELVNPFDSAFTLESNGLLRVGDGSLLNYEGATTRQFGVRVRDTSGRTFERTVTVAVADANEANSLPARYDFSVGENLPAGAFVGEVAAGDLDASGTEFASQRYGFLVGGALQQVSNDGLFAIDAATGVVTTRVALDHETIASASYVVAARDNEGATGANQAETTIHIAVGNSNEANSLPASLELHLAENGGNGDVVGQVAASDLDGIGSQYREQRYYFRVNGALSATSADSRYTIDALTGVIRATRAMDRESPDASTNHVVVARDNRGETGFNEAVTSVTIVVDNVNEAPTISGDQSTLVLAEPVSHGTVLASVNASDPDGTAPALQLASNTNLFAISGTTVVLANTAPTTFHGALAYGAARGIGATDIDNDGRLDVKLGTVEVVASDGQYGSATFRRDIYFEDVNETPDTPSLSSSALHTETGGGATPHANQLVATFTLTDPDGSQPALVITGGNANGWFTVSGNGIYFAPNVDFTADYLRQNFGTTGGTGFTSDVDGDGLLEVVVANLSLAARDADGAFSAATSYAVRIEDRNEAPVISVATYEAGVSEAASIYTKIAEVRASDIDGPASALRYDFVNGTVGNDGTLGEVSVSTDGRLYMVRATGDVHVASTGSFSGQTTLSYGVRVTDRNGGSHALTASAGLQVNVTPFNDPHTLTAASGSINEASNLPPLTELFDLREEMLQDPEGQNMLWRFSNGTSESGIWLLTSDGKLTLKTGSVDYETLWPRTQALEVQAIDPETNVVATNTFTVTVNDVNEHVTLGGAPNYIEDDDDPAGVFKLANTQYYVMGEVVEGSLISLSAIDPEGRALTYAIRDIQHTDYNIYGGDADNDIDSGYPTLFASSNGVISFNLPPGSGGDSDVKWQGGTRTLTLGRREHGIVYSFNVEVTDSLGLVTTVPFTIKFLRRKTTTPPVVFDLDGDGLELVESETSTVYFDMDLDGIGDRTGWVAADDAMLVLDRNGNGLIDDANEISFTDFVEGAQTDLEGLVAFDTNQDGVLDASDERFFEFQVWRDLDQDGVSDAGELLTWDQAGISSLSLAGTISENPFVSPENLVHATTTYLRRNGSTGVAGDVLLAYEGSAEIALAAPVLLDFDRDGTTLVGLSASKTLFDQDGDGDKERTAWFEGGDAILAVDRNKNGVIDDISEISFLGDLEGAKTDLEGLAAYDHNKDGKVDATDIDFAALKLWFDKDSDGVTDAGELRSLSEAGIAALSLSSSVDATTGEQADGSVVYGKATFVFDNGTSGTLLDTGLAYLANATTHATAIAGQAAEPQFAFGSAAFERSAKKHAAFSLGGELAVKLRKEGAELDPRAGSTGAAVELDFAGKAYGYLDAIVLDLDGDGVETKHKGKTRAAFDMNGDGAGDDTGWVASRDGLLVVDRNGNGAVDDGSELSFMLDDPQARSALGGLAAFDSNDDGLVSRLDQRFGELKVWVDADHDGVSDAGEITSLADNGIVSISLRSVASDDARRIGYNVTLSTTIFTREDGSTHTASDVAFGFKPGRQAASSVPGVGIAEWIRRFEEESGDGPVDSARPQAAGDARRLSLMLQDMAAFGTEGALHDQDRGRDVARAVLDFHA